jgi:lipoprotein YgeR
VNVCVKRRTPDEKTLCYCNNVAEQPDRRGVFQLIRFRFHLHREARRHAVRYLTFHWHQRQDLARLNNISPPYTIEVGQKLKLNSGSGTTAKAGASGKKSSAKRTAAVTPSSAVPQSSWPPVGQRCWRWPTSGKVVLPYSTSDGGNKGIDIAGKRGQPVYAAGAGKVVYVGNQLRGYGNLIMIKHNEDYISAYAHNDKLMVNNGQSVKIGQQIATMGSSDADSVRLHFQIRYRATAIDPLRYLPPQGSKPKC